MFKETFLNYLHIPIQHFSSNKLFKILRIVCFVILISASSVNAHSGRTDSSGGHHVIATGEYHFHHGYPAHQHTNGICPYTDTVQTQSKSNSNSGLISENDSDNSIIIIVCIVGGVGVIYLIKSFHTIFKNKQQFKREKIYFSNLYSGKTIYELANMPENIKFDENDLPISNDDSGLKWGKEFTVYVSNYGQCYHIKCGCSGAKIPEHILNKVIKWRGSGCSKCSGNNFEIPEWYYKYIEIKKIKNKYSI